jgi:hypothetical protein
LGSQQAPSGTIGLDGAGSHRTMVQPILVLFYDQGGTHLFAATSDRSGLDALHLVGVPINTPFGKIADTATGVRQ